MRARAHRYGELDTKARQTCVHCGATRWTLMPVRHGEPVFSILCLYRAPGRSYWSTSAPRCERMQAEVS